MIEPEFPRGEHGDDQPQKLILVADPFSHQMVLLIIHQDQEVQVTQTVKGLPPGQAPAEVDGAHSSDPL